jgi:hypothetical protein
VANYRGEWPGHFSFREKEEFETKRRVNGTDAMFVLSRRKPMDTFIRRNWATFQSGYFDEFYFFNDEGIKGVRNISGVQFKCVDVTPLWLDFPIDLNMSLFPKNLHGKHHFPLTYRQMCRFFFQRVFELPEVANVARYMRLDSDVCSELPSNPFDFLSDKVSYVSKGVIYDGCHAVCHLASFVEDYVDYFGIKVKNGEDYRVAFMSCYVTTYPRDAYLPSDRRTFRRVNSHNNQWELMKIGFWFRADVQFFVNFVESSKGIFYWRWGDAPLRYLALALFGEPGTVVYKPSTWPVAHTCLRDDWK